MDIIRALVRDVPDFPKPGIIFKDITPVLQDCGALQASIDAFAERFRGEVDVVAGIDSRGFIFGAPLALALGLPFVPVRKQGKLPWRAVSEAYALEYGEATVAIHQDALQPGDRVLLLDDLLATGGTASAAIHLLEKLGAEIVEIGFLIELSFLNGREKLGDHPINALITY